MKTLFLSGILILATLLAGSIAFNPLAFAAEKDAPVNVPDTVAGIWQVVDQETADISKELQTGNLGDLHQHAFAIRNLIAALPARSASLPPDKLAKVKSDAKFVATLAQRLDAAGDANNKTAAESNFQKLTDILKSIRRNYSDIKSSS